MMTPTKASAIYDAYLLLIELTAKQNLESLQDVDNAIRSRHELTENQKQALLDFSRIEYKMYASDRVSSTPHLLTEDSIPLRSFSGCKCATAPWCIHHGV